MQHTLTRNILFVLVACVAVWKFMAFSPEIKKDQVWYSNSDQNGWVLFSTLDFNDGRGAKYISHPGISTSYVYGLGLKVMKRLGLVELAESSDLENLDDPIAYFPQLYNRGAQLSAMLILLCAGLMGAILLLLTARDWEYAIFGFIMTLFSCGFLFHSVMLRNELTSVFYFIVALMVFMMAYVSKRKRSIYSTASFLISGLLFGLAYFAKSQVVVTTIFFFLFLFYFHFTYNRRHDFKLSENIVLICGHGFSYLYLTYGLGLAVPLFWKLVYALAIGLSLISLLNIKFSKSQFLNYIHILNRFSLGFTLSIAYTMVRGLQGEKRAAEKVLTYTSFWNPDAKSIQAQTIDKDFSSILARFGYFLQCYFLESFLLLILMGSIYLVWKKQVRWRKYILALILIVVACYLNSMRSNLTVNMGRAVFKYIIYIDVAVIMLVACSYRDLMKTVARKQLFRCVTWGLLIGFCVNNYYKVKNDTDWNWTTYSDIVFPERWLFPGSAPYARKVLKQKYSGFINGHDRVVFGDEMPRVGELQLPGGARHLARVQKLSAEPYMNRLQKLFGFNDEVIEKVVSTEARLLNFKIGAFESGDDYQTIVDKTSEKRKYLYRLILSPEDYRKYLKLIETGKLSVPF